MGYNYLLSFTVSLESILPQGNLPFLIDMSVGGQGEAVSCQGWERRGHVSEMYLFGVVTSHME